MISKLIHRACLVGLSLALFLGTTAWQNIQTITALVPGDGSWIGTTSRGHPMSFTVSSSGAQWSNFKVKTYVLSTNCSAQVALEVTIAGPGSITSSHFSYTSSTYSFAGQFSTASTASGTYTFTNYPMTFSLPLPPYICTDYLTESGTWIAGGPVLISGNAGVAGATLNYVNGTIQTVIADGNGNYSILVPYGWSGNVTPSKTGYIFNPPSRTYNNASVPLTGQDYTATRPLYTISGHTGVAEVTLSYIDGTPKTATSDAFGNYSFTVPLAWSAAVTPTHSCFTFSPTSRTYNNTAANQPSQDYTASFRSGSNCADVNVSIGGTNQGRFGLPAHGSSRTSFSQQDSGPVKIVSSNAVSLIGAERVIYKVGGLNTSFTEMMGLPDNQLDKVYWLPWYNNVDLDTQIRLGNVSENPAQVHIFIGNVEKGIYSLPAGQSFRASFAGVNSGPVKIQSDQNIVAAERVIYKVNGMQTSFSEMMALPNSQLNTTYWLPWYNNVDLDTQLRIGNVSSDPATVHIFVGGTEVTPVSGISLGVGASTRLNYPGINNGPVKIQSDQPVVAAERVVYKVNSTNTSFTEMMALPNSQLNTTYWLPWYNNADLDTQLRFGNVSSNPAQVHIYVGGTEMLNSPFNLGVGESTRVSFTGINNGPVKIQSDQNIVAAERVIYKVNGIQTSFSEMMALPNSQLNSTYWLPWYNNVDLDTQLRFGVP